MAFGAHLLVLGGIEKAKHRARGARGREQGLEKDINRRGLRTLPGALGSGSYPYDSRRPTSHGSSCPQIKPNVRAPGGHTRTLLSRVISGRDSEARSYPLARCFPSAVRFG